MTDIAPAADHAAARPTRLSGPERAAVVLSLLEPDLARSLAERFDDGRTERAIRAFENLPMLDRDELLGIVTDYIEALSGDVPVVAGGQRRASELANALAPPQTDSTQDGQGGAGGFLDEGAAPEDVWAYVRGLEPEKLAILLIEERAAVISAVLQRLDREGASAVLSALPQGKASDVTRLLLGGRKPTGRTYEAIAESLRRTAPQRLSASSERGLAPLEIAEIFNCMPAATQQAILEPVRPEMAREIEALEAHLLSFPNLHERLPRTVVPSMFREIDRAVLDRALGHALKNQPETAEFLLGSISQRLAEQIRERIDDQPPFSDAEGEQAQANVMQTLIAWSEEDRFAFKKPITPDQ